MCYFLLRKNIMCYFLQQEGKEMLKEIDSSTYVSGPCCMTWFPATTSCKGYLLLNQFYAGISILHCQPLEPLLQHCPTGQCHVIDTWNKTHPQHDFLPLNLLYCYGGRSCTFSPYLIFPFMIKEKKDDALVQPFFSIRERDEWNTSVKFCRKAEIDSREVERIQETWGRSHWPSSWRKTCLLCCT